MPWPSSLAITYQTSVPWARSLATIWSDSLLGTRGSLAPWNTIIGFFIFSLNAIGEIFSNTARIFGTRSSPYSARRRSRR